MSIIRVVEKRGTRDSEFSEDRRQHRRVFVATSNAAQEAPMAVKEAAGVPRLGTPYSIGSANDIGAICVAVRPRQVDKFVWNVECRYEYSPREGEDPEEQQPPLQRPPEITWGMEHHEIDRNVDADGTVLVNSAGDPFDPLPPELAHLQTYLAATITRNEPAYDPQLALRYANKINSDQWYSFPPSTTLLKNIAGHSEYEEVSTPTGGVAGVRYWKVTYELLFKEDLWNPVRVIDVGPRYKDSQGSYVLADDDNEVKHGGKIKLDGAGGKQAATAEPFMLEFNMYKSVPFAALNLP